MHTVLRSFEFLARYIIAQRLNAGFFIFLYYNTLKYNNIKKTIVRIAAGLFTYRCHIYCDGITMFNEIYIHIIEKERAFNYSNYLYTTGELRLIYN